MMEREGNVEEHMMYNTYNMGIGMIVAVDPADVEKLWKQCVQPETPHM